MATTEGGSGERQGRGVLYVVYGYRQWGQVYLNYRIYVCAEDVGAAVEAAAGALKARDDRNRLTGAFGVTGPFKAVEVLIDRTPGSHDKPIGFADIDAECGDATPAYDAECFAAACQSNPLFVFRGAAVGTDGAGKRWRVRATVYGGSEAWARRHFDEYVRLDQRMEPEPMGDFAMELVGEHEGKIKAAVELEALEEL